jgi:hypothetical protein
MVLSRFCGALLLGAALVPLAGAGQLVENFDDITTLAGAGWAMVNNSAPVGSIGWFQGNPSVFSSQTGNPDSYIGANFNAAAFGGNISLWLLTPVITLDNGVVLDFWTRTESPQIAPDSLEVRASTNGASTNVGASDTSVGDFTNLLLTINPGLTTSGYPGGWTEFTATVSGLGGPVSGRFAFRYAVPDTSLNADYIGIDTVSISSAGPVPEPSTLLVALGGLAVLAGGVARRPR